MTVYNPFAAKARVEAERLFAEAFGRDSNILRSKDTSGAWLRQDGADGQSIIAAANASNKGLTLTGATVLVFDANGRFMERVDAAKAELLDGVWRLENAWVARLGESPEKYGVYLLSTYLTPDRVADALGNSFAVSFWELPALIEVAEKAKLSSARLRLQLESLFSRPILCVAMVLLAATVSLRSFRSGGIQTMVIKGILGGFAFFMLAEVSRQIGAAALVPVWVAVWPPISLAVMVSLTVLLHQEDG
jgi:lipopolysaccharide export system permease protein